MAKYEVTTVHDETFTYHADEYVQEGDFFVFYGSDIIEGRPPKVATVRAEAVLEIREK